MKKYTFLLLLLTVVFSNAQNTSGLLERKNYYLQKIDPAEGIIENSIQTVFQDSDGFMWFGTPNGLYKYDGYHFKAFRKDYKNPHSLYENSVNSLFEDSRGFLWIATDKSANIYDRDTEKFISISNNYDFKKKFGNNIRIKQVVEDNYQNIWIATNNGVFKLTPKNNNYEYDVQLVKIHKKTDITVETLFKNSEGDIYVGTQVGYKKISKALQQLKTSDLSNYFSESMSLKGCKVYSFCETPDNYLWIGTHKGLFLLQNKSQNNKEVPKAINQLKQLKNIKSITADEDGSIWIGTQRNGLVRFNYQTHKITKFNKSKKLNNLKSNTVASVHYDKSGVLWIGTLRGGLYKLDTHKKDFFLFADASSTKQQKGELINAIYENTPNDLWVATFNNGLYRLRNSEQGKIKQRVQLLSADEELNVFSITKDNYNRIWVSTHSNGLYALILDKNNNIKQTRHFTTKNTKGNLPTDNIQIVYCDQKEFLWLGSFNGGGLMQLKLTEKLTSLPKISIVEQDAQKHKLTSKNIASIYEDKKGTLWIGTKEGLNKITRNQLGEILTIKQYGVNVNMEFSLPNNNIFCITEDNNNEIWLGTFGGGICHLIEKEGNTIFEQYTTNEGLPSNAIYGILADKTNNLWISTNNGLSKFNCVKKTFHNYNISDGIQDRNFRKFAYHKGRSGTLYFGGINGFNAFIPKNITDQKTAPVTAITDLKIYNKSIGPNEIIDGKTILNESIQKTKKITLDYDVKSFSFEFAALHYSAPQENLFAYKLEGYDDQWIKTNSTRRFASYSNLNHGDYVFKVKSANKDGIWNEQPVEMAITVLPPFWETWWMYTIYLLSILGLLAIYRKYIIEKEKYNSQFQMQELEKENLEKINKMKLQFFTNISHEFKTPLTLILGPLEKLLNKPETDKESTELLNVMQNNAKQLYKLIQQVLDLRKLEHDKLKIAVSKVEMVAFCENLLSSFKLLAEKKNITLKFTSSQKSITDWFDTDILEKTLNNLLSNALKFTPENGKIDLKLAIVDDENSAEKQLKIEVIDNGKGIAKDKIAEIFNRFYQIENKNAEKRGAGIGLSFTKSIIELHGGKIAVRSKENNGTTFTVLLPLNKDYTTTDDMYEVTTNISKPAIENVEKPSEDEELPILLIVEDNDAMRKFVKDSFKNDFKILEAPDGEKGIELALNNIPDIIISDVMMPIKDGIVLCDTLKNNELTNHIPIILLTAKTSLESKLEGINTGADAYIPKPFSMAFLTAKVNSLLASRKLLIDKYSNETENGTPPVTAATTLKPYDQKFLEKAEKVIEENLMNTQFGVNELGSELAYSRMQLYRKLKSITNLSANEFIRDYRLKRAAVLLKESDLNITEILYEVGFSNRSYFTKCFKLKYNKTPKEFRNDT